MMNLVGKKEQQKDTNSCTWRIDCETQARGLRYWEINQVKRHVTCASAVDW